MPSAPAPTTPTSQGSTVSFGGTALGKLTQWRLQPGTATYSDSTCVWSPIKGTGANVRVVREADCTGIEPGSVTIRVFGCPPHVGNDVGRRDSLAVTFDGGSFSASAFLESFDVTGNVGEFLVGTATFKFSGQDW